MTLTLTVKAKYKNPYNLTGLDLQSIEDLLHLDLIEYIRETTYLKYSDKLDLTVNEVKY